MPGGDWRPPTTFSGTPASVMSAALSEIELIHIGRLKTKDLDKCGFLICPCVQQTNSYHICRAWRVVVSPNVRCWQELLPSLHHIHRLLHHYHPYYLHYLHHLHLHHYNHHLHHHHHHLFKMGQLCPRFSLRLNQVPLQI